MLNYMRPLIRSMHIRRLSYGKLKTWYCSLVKRPPPIPPYSHITQIGDPVLRGVSELVPADQVTSAEVKFLIAKLKTVFQQYNCIGLSAPQIGIGLRIFIVEFNETHAKSYTKEELKMKEIKLFPQTVVVNPELKIVDYKQIIYSEACESVKGFWADVPRYRAVELSGFNENGEKVLVNANGWLARIIQHEMDHLNGKLYTDVMDRKTLTCSCWDVVNEKRGKVELPFHY